MKQLHRGIQRNSFHFRTNFQAICLRQNDRFRWRRLRFYIILADFGVQVLAQRYIKVEKSSEQKSLKIHPGLIVYGQKRDQILEWL